VFAWNSSIPRRLIYVLLSILLLSFVFPQTTDEEEDPEQVFWGEGEEYDDEYFEDDTLGYEDYFDEEEYTEDDEYYEDEYYDDEFADTSYYEDEYYDDEYYDDEELSEEELADFAESKGFTVSLTGASPGYVNQTIMTYNSTVDYRVSLEFPLLLQISVLKFRVGFEFATYSFSNGLPEGGEITNNTFSGFLSFPAGPGQVKVGAGTGGGFLGYFAETSYGFALGNKVELRAGIRSTTVTQAVNTKNVNLGNISWMDGLITLGLSL